MNIIQRSLFDLFSAMSALGIQTLRNFPLSANDVTESKSKFIPDVLFLHTWAIYTLLYNTVQYNSLVAQVNSIYPTFIFLWIKTLFEYFVCITTNIYIIHFKNVFYIYFVH